MFSKEQKRLLLGCFVAYAAAYTGRLNLAQALSGIGEALSLSGLSLGALQTAFAVTYAAGQLVVGTVVDRLSPRTFIRCGLIGTLVINLCFGFANRYPLMLILWTLNGAAQSMLWTPIIRLVSEWFQGEARSRAAFIMSAATITGHLLGWAITGCMARAVSWRFSFIMPAAILLVTCVFCWRRVQDSPKQGGAEPGEPAVDARPMPVSKLLFGTGLWILLLTCVFSGFVRDGITTWGPSMIVKSFGGGMDGAVSLSLIIPLLSMLGWLGSRMCFHRLHGDARRCIAAFLTVDGGIMLALCLLGAHRPLPLALLMGLGCAVMHGNTPLLTAMLPVEYESARRVALVAGLVDCFIYLGSALSGVVTGYLNDLFGWRFAPIQWMLACALGAVCAAASIRLRRRSGGSQS